MLRMNFPGRKGKRREEAEARNKATKPERTKRFRKAQASTRSDPTSSAALPSKDEGARLSSGNSQL